MERYEITRSELDYLEELSHDVTPKSDWAKNLVLESYKAYIQKGE